MKRLETVRIELVTENSTIGVDYYYAELSLPATGSEIRDAMQRVRMVGRQGAYQDIAITECPYLLELAHTRLQAPTIRELNFFAERLAGLPEEESRILEAIFHQRKERGDFDDGVEMKELINLTYGLDSVSVASNVTGDEQLGQLVIDSEMNEDVNSVPENALYLLDKAKIGKFQRYNDDGLYWRGRYFAIGHYEPQEVYDGIHLPKEPDVLPGIFILQLGASGDVSDPVRLSLPISRTEAERIAQEIGKDRIEDCTLCDFESAISQIGPGKFESMANFDTLNAIAARVSRMSEMEQIKYKAVLIAQERQGKHTLADTLEAAKHIGEYELAYYADNSATFASMYLALHLPAEFDIRWLDTVRAAGMGAELMRRLGAFQTEYGVVSARGKPLFALVPKEEQKKEQKQQALTGEQLEVVEVCGQKALFSNGRYTDAEVPAGLYKYELRGAAGTDHMTIEKSVLVDHSGTLFMRSSLDLEGKSCLIPDDESSLKFLGYDMTVGEFQHTDFTQETGGMQLE